MKEIELFSIEVWDEIVVAEPCKPIDSSRVILEADYLSTRVKGMRFVAQLSASATLRFVSVNKTEQANVYGAAVL